MDRISKSARSRNMAKIRGKNTTPELLIRRLIRSSNLRCRYHVKKLPGCPDFVFAEQRKIIFVHGCFWHRHRCRKGRSTPSTRAAFWRKKLESNRERDQKTRRKLRILGWKVMIVWECQLAGVARVKSCILDFLA